jgi:hypothetical protein
MGDVMKKKTENESELRITQQFRSGRAMVYDLRDRSSRLTLRIYERESSTEPGDFRVEAATRGGSDVLVVTGWGSTRAEALRETARSWGEARSPSVLPVFDWEAIARALVAVRAV